MLFWLLAGFAILSNHILVWYVVYIRIPQPFWGEGGEKRGRHVQLHLHECRPHTPAAHANETCMHTPTTRASGDAFTCSPAISAARLQTPHGPLVEHSPEVGDPRSTLIKGEYL